MRCWWLLHIRSVYKTCQNMRPCIFWHVRNVRSETDAKYYAVRWSQNTFRLWGLKYAIYIHCEIFVECWKSLTNLHKTTIFTWRNCIFKRSNPWFTDFYMLAHLWTISNYIRIAKITPNLWIYLLELSTNYLYPVKDNIHTN